MNRELIQAQAEYLARSCDIEQLAKMYEETKDSVTWNKSIAIAVKIQCGAYGKQLILMEVK